MNPLSEQYDPTTIIETLEPYVTARRQQRIKSVLDSRLQSIQLAIEAPSDINNALAAVRSSEALGISTVHIIEPEGDARSARTITQGAIYWVDVIYHDSLADFLSIIQSQSIILAGGTVNATEPLSNVPVEQPLCIMMGNEQRGLSPEAEKACDIRYTIPMFGMSESLNLSVSAAISLYDTTQRKRQQLKANGDLTPSEYTRLKSKHYLRSVDQRTAATLLKTTT